MYECERSHSIEHMSEVYLPDKVIKLTVSNVFTFRFIKMNLKVKTFGLMVPICGKRTAIYCSNTTTQSFLRFIPNFIHYVQKLSEHFRELNVFELSRFEHIADTRFGSILLLKFENIPGLILPSL